MSSSKKISVVIPTYNCSKYLSKCLSSVSWANEIIIVDMGSTDKTLSVAKKFNAKIFKKIPADGNFDNNRKFGMEKASSEWILKLDSDELIPQELEFEIRNLLHSETAIEFNGYYIFNKIIMFGKEVKHGFIKPKSNEMRLFRQGTWKYNPFRFHQQIVVEGSTSFLKNYYLHTNYATVFQFLEKMNKYTNLDSKIISNNIKVNSIEVVMASMKTFLKLYLFQLGFLDKLLGFQVTLLYSLYNFIEKIKIWEIQQIK